MTGLEQSEELVPGSLRSWAVSRRRTLIGWSVLIVLFAGALLTVGLPMSEDTVLLWLAAALFVASLDDLKNWRSGVLRDWLPLYAVLFLYSLLRGYASHVLWGPFVRPQLAFDQFIGMGTEPTARLQQWLFSPGHLHWWDYAAWAVYTTHFFASYVIAAVLWKRDHERFRRFISLFVGLTFTGYLGYLLYPAMPPWMAAQAAVRSGYRGATIRIIPLVWRSVGLKQAAALFTRGDAFANSIAAMPSLHAAYPVLILLFFWRRARPPLRALLAGYVLAMAFSLVYTGEHFVADVAAGWACAAAVFFGGSRLLDWRQARRRSAGAPG
jgi:membrane-associated phospholipid phosphatase